MKSVNIVELMAMDDEDCAFDQACKHGHRVGHHGVYCHNDKWEDAPRKCKWGSKFYGSPPHNECSGFVPNSNGYNVYVPSTGQVW